MMRPLSSTLRLPPVLMSALLALTFPWGQGEEQSPPAGYEDPFASGSDPGGVDPEIQLLREELESILTSTGNRRGRWGVLAVSLDRHDTIVSLNPDLPLVPASNVKLLSTAAALHYLGPDYRFQTFLLADGHRAGPEVMGDLILYGTGDPTFSDRFFPSVTAAADSLAEEIVGKGIRAVHGDLVVDGSFFEGPWIHPEWKREDLNDPFAAPVAALSVAENVVTVRVEAGEWVGAAPSILLTPSGTGLPVHNMARTAPVGTRSRVWLLREDPADPIGIEGEIPLGGPDVWRRLPVPDPLRFAGLQMKQALEARGIEIHGTVRPVHDPESSRLSSRVIRANQTGPPAPRVLARLESPPLLDVLRVINKESNNFLAETVAKTMGRAVLGEGSFQAGSQAVERFLRNEVGAPAREFRVRDGSGLAEGNRVSANVLVKTLQYMAESPFWEPFLETLPEAGVRRELRRMYRSPAARNLRAKTGTMDRVSALSGWVQTRSGERILFSILSNEVPSEYRAKRAEDRLCIRLASLTRPVAN